jgi:hypothetical protein
MANIIPSQKIARTALDFFIVLFFLLRASVPSSCSHRDQTNADPLRFSARDLAQEFPKKAAESLAKIDRRRRRLAGKSNATVTKF